MYLTIEPPNCESIPLWSDGGGHLRSAWEPGDDGSLDLVAWVNCHKCEGVPVDSPKRPQWRHQRSAPRPGLCIARLHKAVKHFAFAEEPQSLHPGRELWIHRGIGPQF
jgi:hypothetical protein